MCVCVCVFCVCVGLSDSLHCNAYLMHAYCVLSIAFVMQNNDIVCLLCHILYYTQNKGAKIKVIRHKIIKLICSHTFFSSNYY